MNKIQIIIIAGSILVGIIALFLFAGTGGNVSTPPSQSATGELAVWGLVPKKEFDALAKNYTLAKISYTQKEFDTFSNDLIEALASGTGPDLVIAPANWINTRKNLVAPFDTRAMSVATLKSTYIDAVPQALIITTVDKQTKLPVDNVYGLPVWADPLVLYWNKDIFNANSIPLPPATWTDFIRASNQLRKVSEGGIVETAGAALGRAKNIPLYRELITLLLHQQGVPKPNMLLGDNGSRDKAESVVRFYTDFGRLGTPIYTWNGTLPEPQTLFASGKLAMMIDTLSTRRALAEKNPHLSFDVSKVPQPEGSEVPIHFAEIMSASVMKSSKHQYPAWSFAAWLSGAEQSKILIDTLGVAPIRRDLFTDKKILAHPYFALMKEASLNARYFADLQSIDTTIIIRDMVESVADGRETPSSAVMNAKKKIERIISDSKQ